MRIIAGKHRGRRLATPKDDRIRPTTDRIRESLFNILQNALGGLHDLMVLDAFAGTGALGCEALSRGAARVCFVDRSRDAIALVRKNVEMLGELERSTLLQSTLVAAIPELVGPFDLVFVDPPYATPLAQEAVKALEAAGLLASDAVIVVEQANTAAELTTELEVEDVRVYGTTRLTFLRYQTE